MKLQTQTRSDWLFTVEPRVSPDKCVHLHVEDVPKEGAGGTVDYQPFIIRLDAGEAAKLAQQLTEAVGRLAMAKV